MSRCSKLWVLFANDLAEEIKTFLVPCGSWSCPECAKRNAAKFRRLVLDAIEGWAASVGYEPAKFRYWAKFLTLTLPGNEFRRCHSPAEAEVILKKNWRRFRDRLRKVYGEFDYVVVDELQPSGYPHLHVLLLGAAFGPKSVLAWIRSVWVGEYRMGNVDLRVVDDLKRAGFYLSKYLTKSKVGVLKKNNRVYSLSRGLRAAATAAKVERKSHITILAMGRVDSSGRLLKPFWKAGEHFDFEIWREMENLRELLSYFGDRRDGLGEQVGLFDESNAA